MYIRKNTQHTTQAWCALILLAGLIVALVSAIAGCGNATAAAKTTTRAAKTATYTPPPQFANEPKDGSPDPALVAWFIKKGAAKTDAPLDASMTQTVCDALNAGQSGAQATSALNSVSAKRATLIIHGVHEYCDNVVQQRELGE